MLGKGFPHCPIFPTAASRRSLGRVSVPVWPISLSARLPIADLVGRYPANYLMGRERLLYRIPPLTPSPCEVVVLCGISTDFSVLSPCIGQLVHALLTRPPLEYPPKRISPFDLHVLSTPPAFVLSQDQTLILKVSSQLRLARVLRVPPASLKRAADSSSLEFFGIDKSFLPSALPLSGSNVRSRFLLLFASFSSLPVSFSRFLAPRSRGTASVYYHSGFLLSSTFFSFSHIFLGRPHNANALRAALPSFGLKAELSSLF